MLRLRRTFTINEWCILFLAIMVFGATDGKAYAYPNMMKMVRANKSVAFDNVASSSCGTVSGETACTSGKTLTYSLTVGTKSNRTLAVFVLLGGNCSTAQPSISSVTYNGTSLVQKLHRVNTACANTYSDIWVWPNGSQPDSGAHNVVVTLSGSLTVGTIQSGTLSVYNIDPSNPFKAFVGNESGSGSTASLTMPASTSRDLVANAVCNGSNVDFPAQTQKWLRNTTGGTSCDNSGGAIANGGTTNLSWQVGDDVSQMIGVIFIGGP